MPFEQIHDFSFFHGPIGADRFTDLSWNDLAISFVDFSFVDALFLGEVRFVLIPNSCISSCLLRPEKGSLGKDIIPKTQKETTAEIDTITIKIQTYM